MADPWAAFPVAPLDEDGDPWADFPAAEPTRPSPPKRLPAPPPLKTLPPGQAEAIDGDTLRLGNGTLRLWGYDAPELTQPGWNRENSPVAVGQQSRGALVNLLAGTSLTPGPSVGTSYGRTVAPATIGRFDLAEQLLRDGQGFAAPQFLDSDPERRFDYLQAERLARLNGLGFHDYYVRPPAEHRSDPGYVVPRETTALFFDTPTPQAGMRAEAEQEFHRLLNDPSVPAQAVADYARSNGGFVVDPAEVEKARERSRRESQPIGFGYSPAPKILTDAGDGALGAGLRGYGEGFMAGGLGEAGAFVDMIGGTPGRENVWNSDRRWADIWANNEAQNESILGYDELAHPWASTGGEVGGAITSGFLIPYGAGARTIPQLARVGATYGGLEGFLGTDGGLVDRSKGAAIGAPLGAAVNAVGGKALEYGAPLAVKAWRGVTGRNAATEAVDSAGAPVADEWADFPPPSDPASVAMEAEPMPAITGDVRQRDYIDVSAPVRPQRMDQPLSEAQRRAQAENITPRDVLPLAPSEDWPAGTVQRAGNIDLDKLDTPQDIRRALVQTNDRVGFDAATRGRVTQAETERLAAELNMTPEKLLSRRQGQAFNAEEALAARQLLAKSGNELVNLARRVTALEEPGDELTAAFRKAWLRHVAIQEQVAGATAEAGRALQQFRQAADSRAVRGDVLASMVRGGGGTDRVQDAAQTLLDAVEAGPGVFNAVAEKAVKPKWRDKIAELYVNFLLSGPQTHAVNMASNTLTSLAQIPEHAAAAALGGVRRAFAGSDVDRVTTSEVGARALGLLQGAREGARLFAQALRKGEASDFVSKVEGEQFKAIRGLKGEVIRVPTRLLTAEDEFFKGVARRMELNAEAVRIARKEGLRGEAAKQRIAELVADPTDEMLERALEYGRYLTFQRKLGPLAQKVSAITSDSLTAKIFLPFVRTPTNLIKFAAERSPAAPLLKEWRRDFMAGGARRDVAIAKMLLGTGFGAAIYEGALSGHITGSAPSDQRKARLLYADGWQPYSIKIGDQWYSYKRFDPFSTTIGVAADMATLPEGLTERQREDKATLLVASIMGNLASKTWLSGLSDLTEALTDPERHAGNLKARLVASFLVPNLFTQTARTIDPVRREREGVGAELQSRIPFASQGLLPRRDIWGQPITNGDNLGPDIVSPVWVSRQLDDPVNQALLPLDYAPGYPSRKVGGRELSPQEYDRYAELAGKGAHSELARLVATPEWAALDAESKVKAARKVVTDARHAARETLFGDGSSDEWAAFPVADDKPGLSEDDFWAAFPKVPRSVTNGLMESARL